MCSVGTKFVFDVVCRGKERSALNKWFALLSKLHHRNVKRARTLLATFAHNENWREMLLGCPQSDIRLALVTQLLNPALKCVSPTETFLPPREEGDDLNVLHGGSPGRGAGGPGALDGARARPPALDEKAAAGAFMEAMCELLKDTRFYGGRCFEFMHIFKEFVALSAKVWHWGPGFWGGGGGAVGSWAGAMGRLWHLGGGGADG